MLKCVPTLSKASLKKSCLKFRSKWTLILSFVYFKIDTSEMNFHVSEKDLKSFSLLVSHVMDWIREEILQYTALTFESIILPGFLDQDTFLVSAR